MLVLGLAGISSASGAVFQPIPGSSTAKTTLIPGNGSIFFFGYTEEGGAQPQPWVTDGSAAGTHAAKTILGTGASVPALLRVFTWKGIWYFPANNGVAGIQLWRSDGTDAG